MSSMLSAAGVAEARVNKQGVPGRMLDQHATGTRKAAHSPRRSWASGAPAAAVLAVSIAPPTRNVALHIHAAACINSVPEPPLHQRMQLATIRSGMMPCPPEPLRQSAAHRCQRGMNPAWALAA